MRYKGVCITQTRNDVMETEGHDNTTDSTADVEEARDQLLASYYSEERKMKRIIEMYDEYIQYMATHMPCSASDIAEAVGPSKTAVHDVLRVLRTNNLVIRIRFEWHTLYLLNGDYNRFFPKIKVA